MSGARASDSPLPDSCYYLKPQKGSNGDLSSKDLIYQWVCGRGDLISIFLHAFFDIFVYSLQAYCADDTESLSISLHFFLVIYIEFFILHLY